MDYQWPGSVNLTTLAMKPYNSSDTVVNASFNALSTGVFIRDPVPWLSQWQFYMDAAWTSIIEDHSSYSQIPAILSSENAALFNYLNTTAAYGPTVAMQYEMGYYQPVVT